MICRIEGVLDDIAGGAARVRLESGLTYEVLLPAFAAARLGGSLGQAVTLHTIEYLEGSSQGSSFIPRLAGFVAEVDREFFHLFTGVKSIGPRKALRAMTLPPAQIAAAIAERDVKTLQSLPEIGKRTAETIIATLHDRVDRILDDAAAARRATASSETAAMAEAAAGGADEGQELSPTRLALEILTQLGENRAQALQWIDQARQRHPELSEPQEIVNAVFRIRGSV